MTYAAMDALRPFATLMEAEVDAAVAVDSQQSQLKGKEGRTRGGSWERSGSGWR